MISSTECDPFVLIRARYSSKNTSRMEKIITAGGLLVSVIAESSHENEH
jgi:hypothetical protein